MRVLPFALLAVVAALTACASVPAPNASLDQARGRFTTAQTNPQVAALAPEELARASQALRAADVAWTGKEPTETVDHLAYLASQRVAIAEATAANLASQSVTAGAAAERDKLRLALRTREADTARQQLAASRQSDAQKTAELAQAEAAAAAEKARMEQSTARVADLEAELRALNATKTDRGMVVTLGDVLFDTGQSRLLPGGVRNMERLADVLKRHPQRSAIVEGHTDSVGQDSANVMLSQRRASAVKTALVSLGVDGGRLSTRAQGSHMPVADNGTASGRQMNRRVEIVFTP